jgi:hypothetical protein
MCVCVLCGLCVWLWWFGVWRVGEGGKTSRAWFSPVSVSVTRCTVEQSFARLEQAGLVVVHSSLHGSLPVELLFDPRREAGTMWWIRINASTCLSWKTFLYNNSAARLRAPCLPEQRYRPFGPFGRFADPVDWEKSGTNFASLPAQQRCGESRLFFHDGRVGAKLSQRRP